MQQTPVQKPIYRSAFRLFLGRNFYTCKRYLRWLLGKYRFARLQPSAALEHVCFSHSTPLLRKLRNVDMYLQHNKVTNLRLAVPKLSGVLIRPGETFSYWKLIGKPTRRKGYLDGMVLRSGTFAPSVGGGLCQLSNMIYWMAVHTPLTVIERHRHGYDVFPDSNRTQPFGSGATCAYNYLDLMLRNDTDQSFQMFFEITQTHLVGCILSDAPPSSRYEVYEKTHCIQSEPWGAYSRHNLLRRRVFDVRTGEQTGDEFVVENHALMMYSPLLDAPTSFAGSEDACEQNKG